MINIRVTGLDFKTGKTSIPQSGFAILDKTGDYLTRYPNTRITIEGHTDATGSAEKNLELSEARAAAVREYLIKREIPADRVISKGFGSARPIAGNRTRAGQEQNRRIEIYIRFE